MKKHLIECVMVIALVAVAVTTFTDHSRPTSPTPMLTPAAQATSGAVCQKMSVGDMISNIELTDPSGQNYVYEPGRPTLFVLTATGCSSCLERIDNEDREAYKLAEQAGAKVANLLVYQGVDGATGFVEQHKPSADRVLCDPTSQVSVQELGGSDATCWILIAKDGRMVWRGEAKPESLKKALTLL